MDTEKMTEFDKIKDMWAGFAVTEAAREEIRKTTVCFDESELKRLQCICASGWKNWNSL